MLLKKKIKNNTKKEKKKKHKINSITLAGSLVARFSPFFLSLFFFLLLKLISGERERERVNQLSRLKHEGTTTRKKKKKTVGRGEKKKVPLAIALVKFFPFVAGFVL